MCHSFKSKAVLAGLMASILAGCSMAPQYQRPDVSGAIPGAFPADRPGAEGQVGAAQLGWREYFQDPQLLKLIESALHNNREFTVAQLESLATRAEYGIVRADRLPGLGVDASRSRSRGPGAASPLGAEYRQDQYEVGLGLAAFELDLFGRVKSLSDSALAQYLASEEATRSLQITLVAEVARAYLTERGLAEQVGVARRSLASRERAFELNRQRFQAGTSSQLELRQHEILLESARVAVPALQREYTQALNALDLLVGLPVQALDEQPDLGELHFSAELPAGTPSDLLAARPDIRAAEQRLVSANANTGAARAAFFPRITLVGFAGSASDELAGLFESGSSAWSFVPQVSLPIFTGGRNRANLQLAELRKDAAIAHYERSVQNAFREVADALVARRHIKEQYAAQERLRAAQAQRLALAQERYDAGVASYLEVLDAERELFEAEQQLIQARQLQLANAIDLYRSLGGGLHATTVTAREPGKDTEGSNG